MPSRVGVAEEGVGGGEGPSGAALCRVGRGLGGPWAGRGPVGGAGGHAPSRPGRGSLGRPRSRAGPAFPAAPAPPPLASDGSSRRSSGASPDSASSSRFSAAHPPPRPLPELARAELLSLGKANC